MDAGAIPFSVHQHGAAQSEPPEIQRIKLSLMELYRSRAERHCDIFTGEPIKRERRE